MRLPPSPYLYLYTLAETGPLLRNVQDDERGGADIFGQAARDRQLDTPADAPITMMS